MLSLFVSLHDQVVEVSCPEDVAADVRQMFGAHVAEYGGPARRIITVELDDENRYTVADSIDTRDGGLARHDVPTFLMEAVVRCLVYDNETTVALHAGVVSKSGRAILVAGESGAGKSSLIAWLVEYGFDYLTDEIAILKDQRSEVGGLRRAIVLKPGSMEIVQNFDVFRRMKPVVAGRHRMLMPEGAGQADPDPAAKCGLIIFPKFAAGSEMQIEPLTAAQSGLKLVSCNINARNFPDGGFRAVSALARQAPAVTLKYGNYDQLPGMIEALAQVALDSALPASDVRRFFASLARPAPAAVTPAGDKQSYEIPAATPRRGSKKLTIGMATHDDYDGVYFSLQALRMFHPEVMDDCELIVIDNRPDGPCAGALKAIEKEAPNYRYVPFKYQGGTTASREQVFKEASGEFVVCMDCHVFLAPGSVRRLLDYFEANPETNDLLQGPMLRDDLVNVATHFHPGWREGMYGYWDSDARGHDPESPPFEIPMQGLGLFACRRAAWPGFSRRFRGFGGEEGYIHEKFRRNGGKVLCLPFLRWLHRFARPTGVPYRLIWDDRIRNYIIGFSEVGLPTDQIEQHFSELLGESFVKPIIESVRAELAATETPQEVEPPDANISSNAPS